MTEKRRGLGRGLGALIPSTASETTETSQGTRAGRPVDLFFAAASDEVAPGRAGGRRGAGINKDALRAPAPKKTAPRTAASRSAGTRAKAEESVPEVAESDAPPAGQTSQVSTPAKGTRKPSTKPGRGSAPESKASAGTESPVAPSEAPTEAAAAAEVTEPAPVEVTEPAVAPVDDVSRETLMEVPGARFAELPIDSIHPNRKQPRSVFDEEDMSELVHSIREIGVLQPIVVRPSAEGDPEHPYELVMGERRWRASREAGLDFVPAIVRSTQDVDLLRDALLENLHRSQLNPLEEAAAYQQLLDDFECSHEELAERIGRSRPQISNTLRLMKLPPLVQRRLAAGVLSAGHARALLGLNDPAEMEKLAQKIVAEGMSVRATEEVVSLSDGLRRPAKESKPKVGARHERLDYFATSLSDRLDTSVKITLGARKGKVSIEFASVEDLNRIMGVLAPTPSE
ncbi:ParB/RepB/Spo0J family partition protein [Arthrobacter sp. Sa2CUA1]|uniref:ParB/RepB/Spo0J family partition protein n=1 Tax=Arthrobacter gallicola TaxID=2762225 RepID=A0ABR8UQL7_9MICC|nr:ParB/RepB/Spo0J family partition protein [Arthrobacter gallicola]MBD7994850.1 ParB/RepB/Spo0J family partition protein [Arthrobacter gallicola]